MNRSFIMRTFLLLVFGSLATMALAIQYDQSDLQRANGMRYRGKYREARVLYRAIFRYGRDSEKLEACYFRGFCSSKMGDHWQALADYKSFLENFDRVRNTRYVPDALYVLGQINEIIGEQPSKAQEFYRQCIRRFPGSEFARKSKERLEWMELDMSVPSSIQAADTFRAPLKSSTADPYESLVVDRPQINRINRLTQAIETGKDVAKAVATLSAGDRELESVKEYLRVSSQKDVFKQVHRDNQLMPTFDINVKCAFCGGTGKIIYDDCPACGGDGWAVSPDNPQPCPKCGGDGRDIYDRCTACNGTGWANGH